MGLSSASKLGSEGRNARCHPRYEALGNTSKLQGCGCAGDGEGQPDGDWHYCVEDFICREWIYSDILELTSLFDANRENEIG